MKYKLIIIFLSISLIYKAQYQGLINLDSKYGFNKFKLEEPYSKYKPFCKFIEENNEGIREYIYTKGDVKKIFNYFLINTINLFFYKGKLEKIKIDLEYLTPANEEYILSELVRLYDGPQRNYPADQYADFLYMWLSEKTSLYYSKLKSQYNNKTSVSITIISKKLAMAAKNDQF